jgi:hypothetical protein
MSRAATAVQAQAVATSPTTQVLQRKCACGTHTPGGGQCSACADEKMTRQRRADRTGQSPAQDLAPPSAIRSGGRPLPAAVAERYRPGLGSLVDRVRIHDSAEGNAFAARERAVAVTSGANIYFAAGAFAPHSASGRNLLAHELAHVRQQHSAGGPPAGYQSRPGDRFEREADRFADGDALSRPGAWRDPPAGMRQARSSAEQVATELRRAVKGLGTDEQAIFNALSGRTAQEIVEIKAAYKALSGGEELEDRLRDELSGDDLARAMSLLQGQTDASEAARRIYKAVDGIGTDESAIYATVAGRTQEQWQAIQDAYKKIANEDLITRLKDELSKSEFAHLQTLLPGAKGGAATDEDRATVIANQLQHALDHWFADKSAVFSALTGHSESEIGQIGQRYKLLTGEDLDAKLRDKLSKSEYAQLQTVMHPPTSPDHAATELHDALDKWITDKSAIWAMLTGHTPGQMTAIRDAYQRLYNESLETRLKKELSGDDQKRAMQLLKGGVLDPEDEVHVAVAGLGTDEERLFAVLEQVRGDPVKIKALIDAYAAKGYGDMEADIRGDLSGKDLRRAMEILHGTTTSAGCSASQRADGLEAISGAASLAQNAVAILSADIGAGRLSSKVSSALTKNFNGGNAPGAVTVGLATTVRDKLVTTRDDLLSRNQVTCVTPNPMPCGTTDSCNSSSSSGVTIAWTCNPPGSVVRLCDAFFGWGQDRDVFILHEFVHHTTTPGAMDIHDRSYHEITTASGGKVPYNTLTPTGNCAAADSLCTADSFAMLAKDLS